MAETLDLVRDKTSPAAGFVLRMVAIIFAVSAAVLAIIILWKAFLVRVAARAPSEKSRDRTPMLVLVGLIAAGFTSAGVSVDKWHETSSGRDVLAETFNLGNHFRETSAVQIGTVLLLGVTVVALVWAALIRDRATAFGLVLGVAGYWVVKIADHVTLIVAGNSKETYGFGPHQDARFRVHANPAFSVEVISVVLLLTLVAIYWRRNATRAVEASA